MRPRLFLASLALASIPLLAAVPALAVTVEVPGANGTTGAAGADGEPGQNGDNGGAGGAAQAVADVPGESNTATATGGDGGRGGDGGDGVPAGANGGAAGDGGDGGDALARAVVTGASSAQATATGGGQGFPGTPGTASDPGVAGSAGAEGNGGSATAEAELSANQSTWVASQASARGWYGGNASADASAVNDGTGSTLAEATAVASGGSGDATAVAYGQNGGADPVIVRAESSSGQLFGGPPPSLGAVNATAEGHSSGGADVTVEAVASRFLDFLGAPGSQPITELHDAVSGSTSGLLTLRQHVNPPIGTTPYGGDAATSLTATNPGGGALALDVELTGGDESDAIVADVIGTSVSGADVTIDVTARSGLGGLVLHDDAASIRGESNGGAVAVAASFRNIVGSPGSIDGASIEMIDVVSGDTTGALSLSQLADAAEGTGTFQVPDVLGMGGDALSALTKEAASSSLSLSSQAFGGGGFVGGGATASVNGSNSAGDVTVRARSLGGAGRRGGNAYAEVLASTTGDGHAVIVGEDTPSELLFAAVGGNSQFTPDFFGDGLDAGNATSTSSGAALGDSAISVYASAAGGSATGGGSPPFFPPSQPTQGSGGDGGDASSVATAGSNGTSAVLAKSRAYGGGVSTRFTDPGRAGDGTAQANAFGYGEATAWSIARTYWSPTVGSETAGRARARSQVTGASATARAEAFVAPVVGPSIVPLIRAQSEAVGVGRRETAALATAGGALADAPWDPALHGSAFLTGDPLESDVDAALADNDALAAVFAADPSAHALALGRWQGRGTGQVPLVVTTELQLALDEDPGSRGLYLAAFDTSVLGNRFESLSFSIAKNGQIVGQQHQFDTLESVVAFFTDSLFDLGSDWKRRDTVLARFVLTTGGDTEASIGFAFVQAVPEPGTGLLVALGLLALAWRRAHARF